MTEFTRWQEENVMDAIFANSSPAGALDGPTLALWATNPSNDPDFSNEVTGDSYSRVTTTSSDWNVGNAGGPREYVNANLIDFGEIDTGGDVTVEAVVALRTDTASDEAIQFDDDLTATVSVGQEFKIEAGDASFKLD